MSSVVGQTIGRAAPGNIANLLRVAGVRGGASCLSDADDLFEHAYIQVNASGTVVGIPHADSSGLPANQTITLALNAGDRVPVRWRRLFATGTTIAAADIMLLFPDS